MTNINTPAYPKVYGPSQIRRSPVVAVLDIDEWVPSRQGRKILAEIKQAFQLEPVGNSPFSGCRPVTQAAVASSCARKRVTIIEMFCEIEGFGSGFLSVQTICIFKPDQAGEIVGYRPVLIILEPGVRPGNAFLQFAILARTITRNLSDFVILDVGMFVTFRLPGFGDNLAFETRR